MLLPPCQLATFHQASEVKLKKVKFCYGSREPGGRLKYFFPVDF